MSEVFSQQSSEQQLLLKKALLERMQLLKEMTPPMPYIQSTYQVDLSEFVTVDGIPLDSDDFDTAIKIINTSEQAGLVPVARRRDQSFISSETIYRTTDIVGIEEFYLESALNYLASRPAGPQN